MVGRLIDQDECARCTNRGIGVDENRLLQYQRYIGNVVHPQRALIGALFQCMNIKLIIHGENFGFDLARGMPENIARRGMQRFFG